MPALKSHRGTVLYATINYSNYQGSASLYANVFDREFGAIGPHRILDNNDGEIALNIAYPELDDATITSVGLSISYPDGTFMNVPAIEFGETVLLGWSEKQLLAATPDIDADWHQNRTYVRVYAQK